MVDDQKDPTEREREDEDLELEEEQADDVKGGLLISSTSPIQKISPTSNPLQTTAPTETIKLDTSLTQFK